MGCITQEFVWQQVQRLLPDDLSQAPLSFCVAFSGGLDSTSLLHIFSELRLTQNPCFSLKAIHINHQLQDNAETWALFCRDFCEKRNVPFQGINVDITNTKKLGLEAAARNARYEALLKTLSLHDILITAHHLDDQVETVFLQLLRGTGIDGASAIKPFTRIGEQALLRPLLDVSRKQLAKYAQEHQLDWMEDPSNSQIHINRNYLRHEVLPLIEKRWPSYRRTIKRFSNNARVANEVLEDYIAKDYWLCFNPRKNTLLIEPLKRLVLDKRLLLIRYWIKQQAYPTPSEANLLQVHAAIFAEEDTSPLVRWGGAELRRYRNELYLLLRDTENAQLTSFLWDVKTRHCVKGLGELSGKRMLGQGVQKKYINKPVKIVFRQGGEKCRPVGREGTHSLKKLFQEYAVPPWLRGRVPILMIDNQVAAVVGFFYCAPFEAKNDEEGFIITLSLESE